MICDAGRLIREGVISACHFSETRVFDLFSLLDNIVVDNAKRSGVVHLHWGWRLGMAHEFKGMVCRNGFSAVYVESPQLRLCCQGHDRLDNLCNCEDGAIVWWFGCVVGHEEMSTRPAACL